jgi:hypothetical protein
VSDTYSTPAVCEVGSPATQFVVSVPLRPHFVFDCRNAEDFWERVLPGYQSATKLLARLQDVDGPIQQLVKLCQASRGGRGSGSIGSTKRALTQQRDAFVDAVSDLVQYLQDAKDCGELQLESKLAMGKSELDFTVKLLTVMSSIHDGVFTEASPCRLLQPSAASLMAVPFADGRASPFIVLSVVFPFPMSAFVVMRVHRGKWAG